MSWRCRRAQPSGGDARPNLIAGLQTLKKSTSRSRKSSRDEARALVFIRLNRTECGRSLDGGGCGNQKKKLQRDRPRARRPGTPASRRRWRVERKSKQGENLLPLSRDCGVPETETAAAKCPSLEIIPRQPRALIAMATSKREEVLRGGSHSLCRQAGTSKRWKGAVDLAANGGLGS